MKTFFGFLIGMSLLAGTSVQAAHRGCRAAVGSWQWDTHQTPANLYVDGRVDGLATGSWQCTNPGLGQITVYWSTGYVDTMTVSRDGQTMQGFNNAGMQLYARRWVPPPPTVACQQVIGNWRYDLRQFPATFNANGTVQAWDNGAPLSATWTCTDPYRGTVVIAWSSGITDTMTLSGFNQMNGYNSLGAQVVAWRAP